MQNKFYRNNDLQIGVNMMNDKDETDIRCLRCGGFCIHYGTKYLLSIGKVVLGYKMLINKFIR